jgi:hypothetical protein
MVRTTSPASNIFPIFVVRFGQGEAIAELAISRWSP